LGKFLIICGVYRSFYLLLTALWCSVSSWGLSSVIIRSNINLIVSSMFSVFDPSGFLSVSAVDFLRA